MKPEALVAAILAVMSLGLTHAHATLADSNPSDGESIAASTNQVTLTFVEPIEAGFSLFRMFSIDPLELDDPNQTEMHWHTYLQSRNTQTEITDITISSTDPATITISWPQQLAPGSYLVVWRVLSIDTHISNGYLRFTVLDN